MQLERQIPENFYQADRPLHHELALAAYRESFRTRTLTDKYEQQEFRRLNDVFQLVSIGDLALPTIKRSVDTFDLTNPLQASKLRDACKQDLPNPARTKACLKAIDRYCQFLKVCPTVYLPGQKAIYLPEIYGPIESPLNRYTITRHHTDKAPNFNYLEASEYKTWLHFTWSQIDSNLPMEKFHKAMQLHLMCVIAGEMGLRLQEILGLQLEHFSLKDGTCLVTWGKGSNGSGYRKRTVPVSQMAKRTLEDFLKQFPRAKGEPLFQNRHGQRLGKNTAGGWIRELIRQIKAAKLPIYLEDGFGWHAFRRTFTRAYLLRGGSIPELKAIMGWSYTSTISHYMGDSKPQLQPKGTPLYPHNRRTGHGG